MMKHVDMTMFCRAENVNDHLDMKPSESGESAESESGELPTEQSGDMASAFPNVEPKVKPDCKRVKARTSKEPKVSKTVNPADVPMFAKIVRRVDEAVDKKVFMEKGKEETEEKGEEKREKKQAITTEDQKSEIAGIVKQLVEKELVNRIDEIRMLVRCVVNGILDEELRKPKKKPHHGSKKALSLFLQENQKYVLPIVKEAIKEASDMRSVFQTVIRTIWFHADHAENHIVYIPPNAYNSITVHKERGWCNYEMEHTLRHMIQRANDVLQEFTIGIPEEDESKLITEFGAAKYKKLHEFTDKVDNIDDDQAFYKRLVKDTENTVLTSQHLVHGGVYES